MKALFFLTSFSFSRSLSLSVCLYPLALVAALYVFVGLKFSPEVDFASYSIPHPSETRTNVRIQTSDNTTAVDAIFKGLDDLTDICSHVIQTFQAELAKGEFEYYDESAF